jgi:hypothetical protein
LRRQIAHYGAAVSLVCVLLSGCSLKSNDPPSIQFTEIPDAGPGGSGKTVKIAGRVTGAKPDQRLVLFARSGSWYVQPFASKPFTVIQPDRTWNTVTHTGTEYAALLVEPGYSPPHTPDALPQQGNGVIAVATVAGQRADALLPPVKIQFSGYEWDVLQIPKDSRGGIHANSAANVWTDARGWLHLRIDRKANEWIGAEMNLVHSLGYGEYSFVVHEAPPFEPSTVLGMFLWDPLDAGQNHREIDIELSQWGVPETKNAQFAIQPYNVPANVYRFMSPHDRRLNHSFRWEPGRVSFRTAEDAPGKRSRIVAEHVFTSGIPSPGGETVRINLYVAGRSPTPQQNGVEVVIEKFAHLP